MILRICSTNQFDPSTSPWQQSVFIFTWSSNTRNQKRNEITDSTSRLEVPLCHCLQFLCMCETVSSLFYFDVLILPMFHVESWQSSTMEKYQSFLRRNTAAVTRTILVSSSSIRVSISTIMPHETEMIVTTQTS